MMLDSSRTLTESAKIQYIFALLCGKELREFETLCIQIGNMTTTHLNQILLGLGTYFFTSNDLFRQNRAMRHGIRKPRELKVRHYAARMIELN